MRSLLRWHPRARFIATRAWALSVALIAVPDYQRTNPVIVADATNTIEEVLADQLDR